MNQKVKKENIYNNSREKKRIKKLKENKHDCICTDEYLFDSENGKISIIAICATLSTLYAITYYFDATHIR